MSALRDAAMKSKAWPFVEARRVLKRYEKQPPKKGFVLFETGYGPSGLPHIGTLEDPNVFGVGLGFNVYPFGQRKVSYYTGAMIHYSIRDTYVYMDYYDDELEQWIYNSYRDNHNFLGGYVTNGMKLNFNDRLGLNFNLALGFLMDLDYEDPNSQYYYYSDRTRFHALGEIALFYRF